MPGNKFQPEAVPLRRLVLVLVEAHLTMRLIRTNLIIQLKINHSIILLISTHLIIQQIRILLTSRLTRTTLI